MLSAHPRLVVHGARRLCTSESVKPESESVETIAEVKKNRRKRRGLTLFPGTSRPSASQFRAFFDKLAPQFNISTLADWYAVPLTKIIKAGLVETYGDNQFELFSEAYPEHQWYPWLFRKVPPHFWSKPPNQRAFCEWLSGPSVLGLQSMDEWYEVKFATFKKHGAGFLLSLHQNSVALTLKAVYPEHEWRMWRFHAVPRGYWDNVENQRAYLEEIGPKFGITSKEHWYDAPAEVITSTKLGSILTSQYKSNFTIAITSIYPEHPWHPWKFRRLPLAYWHEWKNRRSYFDWLGDQLKVVSPSQWVSVTMDQIRQHHGGSFVYSMFNNSPQRAIVDAYPEVDWRQYGLQIMESTAPVARNQRWKIPELTRGFMDRVGEKLGVTTMEDWYTVRIEDFRYKGGSGLLRKYDGSLQRALADIYPDHRWQMNNFTKTSIGPR